jgi:hypothetical protein
MFIKMPTPVTEEYAERMGYDCGWNGADTTNCRFSIFATPELTAAWERGKKRAEHKRHDDIRGEA